MITPANVLAALLTLLPFLAAAFFPNRISGRARALPRAARLLFPALLAIPYLLVACAAGTFHWGWLALYALLPIAVAALLDRAAQIDPARPDSAQRGAWPDFLVLIVLGLSVDLRWFQSAWPPHLSIFNKILLLDLGLYGFLALRPLEGVGFNLRLRPRDLTTGLRELALYMPIALALGFSLGFLHWHGLWPVSELAGLDRWGFWSSVAAIPIAWFFTFFFVAVPEELFFRGWLEESAGAPPRPHSGPARNRGPLRPGPLQQARRPLQLALCPAGGYRRHLLWPVMAARPPRRRLRRHPRLGRRHLVAMAAVKDVSAHAQRASRRSGIPAPPACCAPLAPESQSPP